MKKLILPLSIIIVIGGIVYTLNKNKRKKEAEIAIATQKNSHIAVKTQEVAFREFPTQYIANGTFQPQQEVHLSAETQGRIIKVLVNQGDYVKAGQTLAIIKGDKQNINVNNAQAVYNNILAELKRFESSYSTGGVTQQQLDQIKLQVKTAKNNLRTAKLIAADVNIKASFSGIVSKKNIEPGTFVAPGQALFNIVNVNTLKLRVNVDEKNIESIKVGQIVKIASSIYPNTEFSGIITFISPKADTGLNFPVEIEIKNNPNKKLKAGMYGTAYFSNNSTSKILTIPRSAFVGSINANQVYVVKNQKAELKTIISGKNFGDYIEVITGLSEGDQVVTAGQINLFDQAKVEIVK